VSQAEVSSGIPSNNNNDNDNDILVAGPGLYKISSRVGAQGVTAKTPPVKVHPPEAPSASRRHFGTYILELTSRAVFVQQRQPSRTNIHLLPSSLQQASSFVRVLYRDLRGRLPDPDRPQNSPGSGLPEVPCHSNDLKETGTTMEGDVGERPMLVNTRSAKSSDGLPPRSEGQKVLLEDEGDNCRICRGEGTRDQPLFYPCKCSGSIRFVHQECLMEWLAHSQKKYCELCKTPFTFTKLYDKSMPSTLPLAVFLQQVIFHAVSALLRNTRYVAVTIVWLCWLPWSIRQVWRGLFWLADGSWVTKARLQEAALSGLASVIENSPNATLLNINSSLEAAAEVTTSQVQLQTSLFSGFVGLFTGDFLLVELAKLVFPSISRWSQDLVSIDVEDDPVILLTMDRQPSLLSNVGFINSLTKYRLLNGAMVDVLEGQLICLFIVIAFILVFLIREWVINQQPVPNLPDLDAVEAVGPGNVQEDAARAARRRRRALRRRDEENHRVADPPQPQPQLPDPDQIAAHQQRRIQNLVDEDDMAQTMANPLVSDNFTEAFPVPTNPDRAPPPQPPSETDSADWVDDDEAVDARPPLPARGVLDNIAHIQRSIEEGSLDGVNQSVLLDRMDEIPHYAREEFKLRNSSTEPGISPHEALQRHESRTTASTNEKDADADEQENSRSPRTPDHSLYPPRTELSDTSSMETEASETEIEPTLPIVEALNILHGTTVAEDYIEYADTSDGESANSITVDTPETPVEGSETIPSDQSEAPVLAERSALGKIFDWFWHIDDDSHSHLPAPQVEVRADDEHFPEDVAAEAPFVRVHNLEPQPVDLLAIEAPVPAPPQEPNMLFGVDLNNPDAMDDAEDLDGILEVIGMQGPIAGMVQNVIFSEFLITLTIAATIWLPYIWGKIALLMLANPIGVFVKAPLFVSSKFADFALDLALFVVGLLTLTITSLFKALIGLAGDRFKDWNVPAFVNTMSSNMTRASGTRLEDTLSKALVGLRPDLPTFSLRSHHALRVIEGQVHNFWASSHVLLESWFHYLVHHEGTILSSAMGYERHLQRVMRTTASLPERLASFGLFLSSHIRELVAAIHNSSPLQAEAIDVSLARWNTQDKFLAIILGYLFFGCIGYIYLRIARLVFGLRSEEKVEGVVADSLRQAGGVVKVVVIIGIEMIVFPLYCGLLLDAALMPLFEGVTLQTRIAFMLRAPLTGVFVHWFIGTCYMFHFALFVSMCRKIFRKGVLYFIRDPDDPTFHPVRDVLERPVMTQLGKIAFSGFIYGGLVYLCLGGVVYILSCIPGILPIHWSTNQPQLAFPVDIVFYNFLLPFILRKTKPSKKIAAMYGWWFRGCAHALRLTNFLFGEERPEEKGTHTGRTMWSRLINKVPGSDASVVNSETELLIADSSAAKDFVQDGGYVRAPASDSVRIPKGHRVFLEVDEKNERIDGEVDKAKGMHGSKDDRFTHVYVPPNFQARITTFIILLWLFAAATWVVFTIGPLLLGRLILRPLASDGVPPNDLYALTIGLHMGGAVLYAIAYYSTARAWAKEHTASLRARLSFYLYPTVKYLLGLLYLGAAACVLPVVFSLLAELYIHVPLYEYLSSAPETQELPAPNTSYFMTLPPTIFLLQTWTVGLVLVRVILREGLGDPETSQPARAIKAIVRRGYLHPDVGLATRALLIPATISATALWLAPLVLGRIINFILDVSDADRRAEIYRYSYPILAGQVVLLYGLLAMKHRIAVWRTKIRDEVYLIGERLHNYQETKESNSKGKSTRNVRSERVEVG
jgi:E3 ubiquitin-protein ligase MARCH6